MTLVRLQVVSLSLVLMSLSIYPHFIVLKGILRRIGELNMTMIMYCALVTRSSLRVLACGLVVCVVVIQFQAQYVMLVLIVCVCMKL
jgi:hypothetical protein